jgi:hypothetical protein
MSVNAPSNDLSFQRRFLILLERGQGGKSYPLDTEQVLNKIAVLSMPGTDSPKTLSINHLIRTE